MFARNITTNNYKIWTPQVRFFVEQLGVSKVVHGFLRLRWTFLGKTRKMCRETSKFVSTSPCNALLRHLQFKYKNIVWNIEETLNVSESRGRKRGYWARF